MQATTDLPSTESASAHFHHDQAELLKEIQKVQNLQELGISIESVAPHPWFIVYDQPKLANFLIQKLSSLRPPSWIDHRPVSVTEFRIQQGSTCEVKITIKPCRAGEDDDIRQYLKAYVERVPIRHVAFSAALWRATLFLKNAPRGPLMHGIITITITGPKFFDLRVVDLRVNKFRAHKNVENLYLPDVHGLLSDYTQQNAYIFLAMVSVNIDFMEQKSLVDVGLLDPTRERTMGILIGLNTLKTHSDDEKFCVRMVKNTALRLGQGWHAVGHLLDVNGKHEKTVFNGPEWSSVETNFLGTNQLELRLRMIIAEARTRALRQGLQTSPKKLISQINFKIQEKQQELGQLGDSKVTTKQQRTFLLNGSNRFSQIIEQALSGIYTDEFFSKTLESVTEGTLSSLKLQAVLENLKKAFTEAMMIRGCRNHVVGLTCQAPLNINPSNPYLLGWGVRYMTRSVFEEYARRELRQHEAFEMHTRLALTAGAIFRFQSEPWHDLAREHVIAVQETAVSSVALAVKNVTGEEAGLKLLTKFVLPRLTNIKESLLTKVDELTSYYKRVHSLPVCIHVPDEAEASPEAVNPFAQGLAKDGAINIVLHEVQSYYDVIIR